jgi:hypothetical protein
MEVMVIGGRENKAGEKFVVEYFQSKTFLGANYV